MNQQGVNDMDIVTVQHYLALFGAIAIGLPPLMSAMIAFFMLVPGEQPEKFLQTALDKIQKAVDFIKQFSKK